VWCLAGAVVPGRASGGLGTGCVMPGWGSNVLGRAAEALRRIV
jgi:hypothetical protein